MATVLRAHPGIGATIEGEVLVTDDGFSARYDLDRQRGVFSRPAHKLFGQSYVGKILAFHTAKGGVASAWMLREMALSGITPLALLFNRVNPILAQGAAFAGLPMLDRFDVDITTELQTGMRLRVDPARGEVTVLSRL